MAVLNHVVGKFLLQERYKDIQMNGEFGDITKQNQGLN